MRRYYPKLILCASTLCATAPAVAQNLAEGVSRYNPAITGIGRLPARRAAPLGLQSPSLRFANDSIIREDGTPGDRRSVVGSLPLVGALAAEVGLFSVSGASPKERETKRADPMGDIHPRRSRVAAVGLRMSF